MGKIILLFKFFAIRLYITLHFKAMLLKQISLVSILLFVTATLAMTPPCEEFQCEDSPCPEGQVCGTTVYYYCQDNVGGSRQCECMDPETEAESRPDFNC